MPPKENKKKKEPEYKFKNTSGAILSIPAPQSFYDEISYRSAFTPLHDKDNKWTTRLRNIGSKLINKMDPVPVVTAPMHKRRAHSEPKPPSYKQGGRVAKTGLALVHKGEVVVPVARVASVDKALKKAGMKPLKK